MSASAVWVCDQSDQGESQLASDSDSTCWMGSTGLVSCWLELTMEQAGPQRR